MDNTAAFLANHWILIAFMAPLFWSLVNIIDVYFVDGIYKDELDGSIISGLFQIIPWFILIFLVDIRLVDIFNPQDPNTFFFIDNTLLLSLFGGIVYVLGIYFYFKALFNSNDAPLLQILANMAVIAVPLFSFLLFREQLPLSGYTGMLITFCGATVLSFNPHLRKKLSGKYFKIMLGAVLLMSLSMVIENHAYGLLENSYGARSFWLGFLFFSLGAFLGALLLAIYAKRNPLPTIRKYYGIFFIGEGLYFLGNFASQKAISIAPSVSYVALIETFGPVFIMAYSLLIIFFSSFLLHKKTAAVKRIYFEQIGGIWVKVLATVIMAVGVYVISS